MMFIRKLNLNGKHGKGKFCLINSDDYTKTAKNEWLLSTGGYVIRYEFQNKKVSTIYLHRELLNAKKGEIIDHIDGNKLNNTRDNLRICTQSQNLVNRPRLNKNNLSGYFGVCKTSKKGWTMAIHPHRKSIILSGFKTKKEAAYVYDQFSMQLFGKYAHRNFKYVY